MELAALQATAREPRVHLGNAEGQDGACRQPARFRAREVLAQFGNSDGLAAATNQGSCLEIRCSNFVLFSLRVNSLSKDLYFGRFCSAFRR
jgi:hypothetical protein